MEVNNFGATNYKEFNAEMDLAGKESYVENYESKKEYIRTSFMIEDYLLNNFNGQQYKLIRYVIYRGFRSQSHNSLWFKETNEEISDKTGIGFDTVKKYMSDFEKKGIIKRYKRHPKDKQHIVLMSFESWECKNPPAK